MIYDENYDEDILTGQDLTKKKSYWINLGLVRIFCNLMVCQKHWCQSTHNRFAEPSGVLGQSLRTCEFSGMPRHLWIWPLHLSRTWRLLPFVRKQLTIANQHLIACTWSNHSLCSWVLSAQHCDAIDHVNVSTSSMRQYCTVLVVCPLMPCWVHRCPLVPSKSSSSPCFRQAADVTSRRSQPNSHSHCEASISTRPVPQFYLLDSNADRFKTQWIDSKPISMRITMLFG